MTLYRQDFEVVYDVDSSGVREFPFEFGAMNVADIHVYDINPVLDAGDPLYRVRIADAVINPSGTGIRNGGYAYLPTLPPVGHQVEIIRSTPKVQDRAYQNQQAIPVQSIEDGLDRLTMMAQEETSAELAESIAGEVYNLTQQVEQLAQDKASNAALAAEIAARIAGDQAEATARGQAISQEATARANADAGLQNQVNAKADKTYVDTQLGGKANAVHTQPMDTVTGLNTALAGKANVSDLAGLATKTEVAAKANTADLKPMSYQNDAPADGKEYNRKNGQWVEDAGGGGSGLPAGGNANDVLAKDASNTAGWKTPAQVADTLPKGTESAFGVVKADGVTITSSGGVLTAVGGGGGEGTSDHRQLSNRNAADQHSQGAITDLTDDLDAIRASVAAKADAAAMTTALAAKANTTDVNTALAGKANTSHTQAISTITGLQGALDAKADKSDLNAYATTEALTNGLADKADAAATTAALALKAPLASPAFTGNPTVPNQAAGTNNTRAANTAFVQAALNAKITYGTTDLTAGTSALATGVLYLVYE